MTVARKESMAYGEIETHHVWSRCVQRAMLCGQDPLSGNDYSHRRRVLRDLVRFQSNVFAVDVGNYSVMGNHFHLILRSRPDIVSTWTDEECAWRYRMAWPSFYDGVWDRSPTDEQIEEVLANPQQLQRGRHYLSSISGFLARVKEPLARRFNAEMKTMGHYWEARFGNRRLETEEETIGCSLYVDLNHVKAGAADSLIASDTSAIQDRLLTERMRDAWAEANSEASWRAVFEDSQGPILLDQDFLLELFRDCWLAPITTDSPLATEEQLATHAAVSSEVARLPDSSGESKETTKPPPRDDAPCTPKRMGRPKLHRKRDFHRRYRDGLKRRKSNRCFIDSAWSAYRSTAQYLAGQIIAARPKRSESKSPHRATASTWNREVNRFLKTLAGVISGLCRVGNEATESAELARQPPSTFGVSPRPPN